MFILEASDAHIGQIHSRFTREPNYTFVNKFLDLIEKEKPDKVVLNGDWNDPMCRKLEEIVNEEPSKSAHLHTLHVSELLGSNLIIVIGNHDPDDNMYKMLYPKATVVSEFLCDGVFYRHGHQHDLGQGIADKVFGWFYRYLPFWLKVLVKPTPAQQLAKGKTAQYNMHCALILDQAYLYQEANKIAGGIIGHTHRAHRDVGEPPGKPWVVDGGSIGFFGTYARVIDGKSEVFTIQLC